MAETPQQKPLQDLDLAEEVTAGATLVALVNWGTDDTPAWQALRLPADLLGQYALKGQRDAPGGIAALSQAGNLMIGGIEILGTDAKGHVLMAVDLPEGDPGVEKALYSNGGAVWISAGPTTE
ncbi:hypothetical protein HK16_18495 [Acetobacter senegalensis]|uniref:Uncharacterized protein n=2 Tax=Acetobacter TaxID=434 RepID=A0A252EG61_9PROT|nr:MULTISPECIES: hypothetical protein [Acetobacter]ATJ90743.1 hypothetical protein CIW82_08600 [Acetobacter tropicalis]OUL65184.1 hypothetical protein HK16_18495 [Acetobacter senegalensis]